MINALQSAQKDWVKELNIVFCTIIYHLLKTETHSNKHFYNPLPLLVFLLNKIITSVSYTEIALKIFILYDDLKGVTNRELSGDRSY